MGGSLECVVKFEFAEEEEKQQYNFGSSDPNDSFMWKSAAVKWIVEEALKSSLRFGHIGLRRISCKNVVSNESIFEMELTDSSSK